MMTHEKPIRDANVDATVIRALSSITYEQADTIARVVEAVGPGWEVQATDDYDGYRSILIAPNASDDRKNSFFVAGTAERLELFEAYDDDMASLGCFDDTEALSERLIDIIGQK